jgi:hypothetical protein
VNLFQFQGRRVKPALRDVVRYLRTKCSISVGPTTASGYHNGSFFDIVTHLMNTLMNWLVQLTQVVPHAEKKGTVHGHAHLIGVTSVTRSVDRK